MKKRTPIVIASLAAVIAVLVWKAAALAAISLTEFTVPTSGTSWDVAAGPDGNVWFTDPSNNKIGKVTPAGVITEFAIPTASSTPWGIVEGPDGNMWFTENVGNKIGKITTSGTITEFSAGITASAFAQGITSGPDGNLWFVEENTHKVAKITTSGTVTEFTAPSIDSEDITTGPDGNLWITEGAVGKIAKVTTSGTFTEFTVPTSLGRPQNIVTGPDGNLWFTERTGNNIGKITTSGVATEFAIPTASSTPMGISNGPDGRLWFVEQTGNKVGQVTTAGVFTEFAIPSAGAQPQWGIVQGPDGNMWFGEGAVSKIGEVLLPLPGVTNQNISFTLSQAKTVNVLSGVSNNPDAATLSIVTGPSHGTATVNTTAGTLTYTPTSGFVGSDTVTYKVCSADDSGLCAQATLTFSDTPGLPNTGESAPLSNRSKTLLGLIVLAIGFAGATVVTRKYSHR